MKTIKLIITGIFFFFLTNGVLAQGPPDPPDGHGQDEDQDPGGNAPISGGVFILLGLGAAYGAKKAFENKRKSE
jgi:hypothetical protein